MESSREYYEDKLADYQRYRRMIAGETDMSSLLPNHIKILSDWVPEGERIALEIERVYGFLKNNLIII